MNKQNILSEIKSFLDGYNNDLKYLVNVETNPATNYGECVIHEPNKDPKLVKIAYEPFMYMKELSKVGLGLYLGKSEQKIKSAQIKHGIKIHKLKTGNQNRLVNGYCYKITSSKSFNNIVNYIREGGIDPYDKVKDGNGKPIKNDRGDYVYLYRQNFFSLRTTEQFFISTQSRLFKGFEEYKDINKLTFDIETTGLRYQISRVFAIGVRNNKNFEMILEARKMNDDDAERKLIQDFFNLIDYLNPAIISGYNSEEFDFEFILGRAEILGMDLTKLPTTLKKDKHLRRRKNTSVKYGSTTDKYTATEMWGRSIIDILHAAKRTAAINSDIKNVRLKYIANFEGIAKPDRIYIDGEDKSISRFFIENRLFLIDDTNNYLIIPKDFQDVSKRLYLLQINKKKIGDDEYLKKKNELLGNNLAFVEWFRNEAAPKKIINFITGKKLVKKYLLDDLWETEQVDERYNQSSFMLAKIIPTTYQRICTMGTAAIWNLLLTTWSYENDIAIPISDVNEKFSGGLARCYKTGYTERIIKIDFASLYPMIQLGDNIFPIFDITNVMKKMLLYLTTTRNIYKKLANDDALENEELVLLKEIDHDTSENYINGNISDKDKIAFKVKQLPIKILNNSLFGALGSAISFNWSDNICAARITCTGRLHLRRAISWFNQYDCTPLLAVTDGVNFQFPETTKIKVTEEGVITLDDEKPVDEMWVYGGQIGISALIEKFNNEEEILAKSNESVTFDSPIYVIDDEQQIDIIPICDLFNENSNELDYDGERDYEKKNLKVLSKSGWSEIKYVFRHKTNKKIHRIETMDRLINITEDHSLFQNDIEIKPNSLNKNDVIDVVDIPQYNNNDEVNLELAWLFGFFFGDGSSEYRQTYSKIGNKSKFRKTWKISNTNSDYLNKCCEIFYNEYGIKLKLRNRSKSQKKSCNVKTLYEIVSYNDKISSFFSKHFYTSYREKKVPKIILNSSIEIKRMFLLGAFSADGYYLSLFDIESFGQKTYLGIAGFAYLLSSLNVDYRISTRKDKENIITLRITKNENSKFLNEIALNRKTNLIWNNRVIKKYNNTFVYDISTNDETFVSGIGGILCHNTSRSGSYISVDDDGRALSCLNLSRINYATLSEKKDKKTGSVKEKVKLTGNTIKSKTMPEYVEDFIDKGLKLILHGKGREFIEYYYDYADDIRYQQIPLKKIASKSKVKTTIKGYLNRGTDKNGRQKAMQAHMELLIRDRNKIAGEIFEERFEQLTDGSKVIEEFTIEEKMKIVSDYMPPEPELDSVVYYVNTGYRKSHGDSKTIKDKVTKEERFCSTLINNKDLMNNPNMTGTYNYAKYLDAFNKRVVSILVGFKPEVRDRILVKLDKNDDLVKEIFTSEELELKNFDSDDLNESMYLEELEVKFWNKTGYDPRLVWNGFKMREDNKIHFEIYEHALNHLNKLMVENNKPKLKSINDKYSNGDLILIKNGNIYQIGLFNGTYIQIIKDNVTVPKTQIEIDLERKAKENEEKISNLEKSELSKNENDKLLEAEMKLREMIFIEFKDKYQIPQSYTKEELFSKVPNSQDAFEDYYIDAKERLENQDVEYGIDFDE